jgi:polyphosphate kinase 2 (PPK2 family)
MGFCTEEQDRQFMQQVPECEHMLHEDGIELVKFWCSISKGAQARRFEARRVNLLTQWKISPVDDQAQEHWERYTMYKEAMFSRTHTSLSPWTIVRANSKKHARLESMRFLLNLLPSDGKEKAGTSLHPDPRIVRRFHRSAKQID